MAGYLLSPWKQRALQFGMIAAAVAAAGLVCAAIIGVVSGFIVRDEVAGVTWTAGAIGGALVGYPLGVVGGLVVLRRILRLSGSLPLGAIGGVLGVALTLLVAGQLDLASNQSVVYLVYFLIVPMLCVFGFLMRGRKAEEAPPSQMRH